MRKHLETDLKLRINDMEMGVMQELCAHPKTATSLDHKPEDGAPDMYVYTMRYSSKFQLDTRGLSRYPFDIIYAQLTIELSGFEVVLREKKYNIKFDCYRTQKWISWKNDIAVDALPDFFIAYDSAKQDNVMEKKEINHGGVKIASKYFPGIQISIPLGRESIQPTMNFYLPAVLVSCFAVAANNMDEK